MTVVEQSRPSAPVFLEPAVEDKPAIFRFPAPDDPAPGDAQILIIAAYGTALGICGMAAGLYSVVAVFGGAPGWYLPALAGLTMASVGPVVAAFLALHRRALPWLLLLAAAPPMAANLWVAFSH
ncbi:hypothetical protein [Actinoplanes derwentensis]|uniref:Transmembrane protein n=1 Tax=Actinoplanes derwentensis TaxID=113562 RepID=A0A1H2CFV8_9ACTN|nr:hypothetical protein [Actinoplanes derwentensis]GID86120.1 hypothetical protein Ade03nite_50440 [Actinoplanes derwentensis]SDT69380.1 hypothetical protein SAMN04489716_5765 [Actinoplanes derwentensis]